MLKSCVKCGRVHDTKEQCTGGQIKREYWSKGSIADKFRNTRAWRSCRADVATRDKYLCQLCIRKINTYTTKIYNGTKVEVHHIETIKESYDKRLDPYNLITVCPYHHKQCDDGAIDKALLKSIADEQEKKRL